MTIVTETMTDINYIAFDSANTVTAYSSVPLDGLPLVVAAADIVAAFEMAGEYLLDIRGQAPVAVSRWDWLTIIRDLGLEWDRDAGDYLPVNADGHDFGGAY